MCIRFILAPAFTYVARWAGLGHISSITSCFTKAEMAVEGQSLMSFERWTNQAKSWKQTAGETIFLNLLACLAPFLMLLLKFLLVSRDGVKGDHSPALC